jgi:hypothetical protein
VRLGRCWRELGREDGEVFNNYRANKVHREVVAQNDESWILEVEVFGKGIEMWLRSQGEFVKEQ